MAWGGPEEQRQEQRAGNPNAKDWHDEALKILEHTMEDYWNDSEEPSNQRGSARSATATSPQSTANTTLESEFDRHRRSLIEQNSYSDGGGWKAELRRYLSDLPDVSKDTDIIEWWGTHAKVYPTLSRIAKDVCAIPATSVPCERLFSAGGEIATKRRSALGAEQFEKLQLMKHAWRQSIEDRAAMNEDVLEMVEFEEICLRDKELFDLEDTDDEIISFSP